MARKNKIMQEFYNNLSENIDVEPTIDRMIDFREHSDTNRVDVTLITTFDFENEPRHPENYRFGFIDVYRDQPFENVYEVYIRAVISNEQCYGTCEALIEPEDLKNPESMVETIKRRIQFRYLNTNVKGSVTYHQLKFFEDGLDDLAKRTRTLLSRLDREKRLW